MSVMVPSGLPRALSLVMPILLERSHLDMLVIACPLPHASLLSAITLGTSNLSVVINTHSILLLPTLRLSSATANRTSAPSQSGGKDQVTDNPEGTKNRDLNDDRGMSVDEEARIDRKGRIGLKVFTEYLSTEIYQREVDYPNSTANDFLLAIKSYLFTPKPFLTPADTIFWIDEWTKRRGMSHIRQLYRDMVCAHSFLLPITESLD
ncbi:hypothetical protein BT69DRAFT_419544 [Atractiella rhizophila]|nr:hypothetical protein BT69DRAFT_419544 [Atractiella rhizophila]